MLIHFPGHHDFDEFFVVKMPISIFVNTVNQHVNLTMLERGRGQKVRIN